MKTEKELRRYMKKFGRACRIDSTLENVFCTMAEKCKRSTNLIKREILIAGMRMTIKCREANLNYEKKLYKKFWEESAE